MGHSTKLTTNDQDFWRLEQRAVICKSWIFVTTTSQFKKIGQYYLYELAGLQVFLILHKDGKTINGFHNVCRHRGYPVRVKDGCARILGCGYHGWSYKTDGSLHKAPLFEDVKEFDYAANALWPLNLHITSSGMIFANVEAMDRLSSTFEEFYGPGLESELLNLPVIDKIWYKRTEEDHLLNWKTIINVYGMSPDEEAKSGHVRKYGKRSLAGDVKSMAFFPSGCIVSFSQGFARVHVFPLSNNKTRVISDYYVADGISEQGKEDFVIQAKAIEAEDLKVAKALMTDSSSLEQGQYMAWIMEQVTKHAADEKVAGIMINPVKQAPTVVKEAVCDPAEAFCSELESLAW